MDDFRACINCKNLILKGDGEVWHKRLCGAIARERARDPFDGIWKFCTKSDLGKRIIVDDQHPPVSDINTDGRCCLYEGK